MGSMILLVPILITVLGSCIVYFLKTQKQIRIFTMATVLITSMVLWYTIITKGYSPIELIAFTDRLSLTLRPDLLGRFFSGIVATLWPFTTLYAFEYLENDQRQNSFFTFFLLAYAITIGITLAGNIFTLYTFYELLTLSTFPLVMHTRTRDAIRASRVYLYLSISGAALAFASMMYAIMYQGSLERNTLTQLFYLLGFLGFGVKAAIFPVHYWLPRASEAPTPVTALLHAVAVVKSGVFAIIRLTFFVYGVDLIKDSFAQYIPMIMIIFTIIYGSTMAVKEIHIKRKMAYSTVANLSYILYGVMLLTDEGLSAGLQHMAFHAGIKILAFFAVGAIMHHNHLSYMSQIDGLARKMPITFATFTISGLALTGIPPLSGFVSKFSLLTAGVNANTPYAYAGIIALLISAFLTAIYTLTISRRGYFPDVDADLSYLDKCKEAKWMMCVPMIILAIGIIVCGLNANIVVQASKEVVSSVMKW